MQRIRQNALIRRDVTVPKGSGGRGSGGLGWSWKRQRASSVEAADTGANRESVAERRAERVVEAAGWKRSGKAGNVDPGMESVKAGFVAGERKAVASIRSRSEERLRRASRRLIRRLAKPAFG